MNDEKEYAIAGPSSLTPTSRASRDPSALSSLSSSSSGCFGCCADEAAPAITARLEELDGIVAERFGAAMNEINASVLTASRQDAERALAHGLGWGDVRRRIADIRALAQTGDGVPRYLVSSLFLAESFRFVSKDADEEMHYVTGPELRFLRVLDRIIHFDKAERTPIRVAAEPTSNHRALIALGAQGHHLTAWIHSHPGRGEWATRPSPTDFDQQRKFEQGHYPAIGAIFSRDGYVRFFSTQAPFRVEVFGAGVRRIDERLYQISVD